MSARRRLYSELFLGLGLALLLALVAPASAIADEVDDSLSAQAGGEAQPAQQAEGRRPSKAIEEITVTATKREENLQEVPIAVSAFTGENLQRRGIKDLEDLQQVAPSLTVYSSNSETNGGTIRIRGMGTTGNNPGLEAAVGTFIDGVYRSRSGLAFGELLDLERAEVLRGPQGTLFGKNTSAGAVHIITARPAFDFGGSASYSTGNFGYNKGSVSLTGPLIEERLAFRVAGMVAARDGYYKDVTSSDKFKDQDRWSVKGQLLWTPTDTLDIRAIYDYTDRDESCCPAVFKVPGPTSAIVSALGGFIGPGHPEDLDVGTNGDPFEKVQDQGLSFEINWDLSPDVTLTSITAWRDFKTNRGQDVDFTSADILSVRDEHERWKNFSSEARLTGTTGPVDWLFGAYTYVERMNLNLATIYGTQGPAYVGLLLEGVSAGTSSLTEVTSFLSPGDNSGLQRYNQRTQGASIFSHNTWHITDRLSFTAGGRYSVERKYGKANQNGSVGDEVLPLPGGLPTNNAWCNGGVTLDAVGGQLPLRLIIPSLCDNAGHHNTRVEREFTGTVNLAYQLTDEMNTYGSYSRGYKSGGFNLDPNANQVVGGARFQNESHFDRELTDAWELGLKGQFLDRRLTLNSAVFYTEFDDFQLNTFKGLFFTVANLPEVTSRGVEVESFFDIAPGVTGSLGFTYAVTRYASDLNAQGDAAILQLEDELITQAPRHQGSAALFVEQPIPGTSLTGFLNTQAAYRGPHNTGSDLDQEKWEGGAWRVNAQTGIRTGDDRYEFMLWVKNLTNKRVNTVVFDSVFQSGSYHTFVSEPRMYGVTVSTRF